ncbi:MAG: DUF1016 family protein [Chitinophagaceae bacterium]|nr:MAG: DUF1016 family protein [Chitinophagaceae bacterium]
MPEGLNSIALLATTIAETNHFFLHQVKRQVNIALTLRNWMIGYYIVEYEQNGTDRANYGERLYKEITLRLKAKGIKSIRERYLYICKDLYNTYPDILRTLSAKSYLSEFRPIIRLPTASAKSSASKPDSIPPDTNGVDYEQLLNNLSFSHFIELLKADTALKRSFYEVQTLKNNWSVRDLQRAMNTMLFERTGLSKDKNKVMDENKGDVSIEAEDIFRNPYMLEFLGLEEKPYYSESDLEEAIINHLQFFLLEPGRGFCFEARQRRITFDNKHYRIDLVFYHRILKCHVLVDKDW